MERGAGILNHISSLKSPYGIGGLGASAYTFVDFLRQSNQKYWQVLPLAPTGYGDSPYQASACMAGNPYFIDLDELGKKGLLTKTELKSERYYSKRVDYGRLFLRRTKILRLAFSRFLGSLENERKDPYLYDYARFMALKERYNYSAWTDWPKEIKEREPLALKEFELEFKNEIDFWLFVQCMFNEQWLKLKGYANRKGIKIIGDAPIYVSMDSADVFFNLENFCFNSRLEPDGVAGVPPDIFSATGQLWGNPLYNWDKMRSDGYAWWKARIEKSLRLYDYLRIDHFRGFEQYYQIPYGDKTAQNGKWMDGPSKELFRLFLGLPIIAEDLGLIDDRVRQLLEYTGFPGMKILQYAFDGDAKNEHKPSNYSENCVVFSGTHDNDTLYGFVSSYPNKAALIKEINSVSDCFSLCRLAPKAGKKEITLRLIELLYASKAVVSIIPLQDIFMEGSPYRMNRPSILSADNWSYRQTKVLSIEHIKILRRLVKKYKR